MMTKKYDCKFLQHTLSEGGQLIDVRSNIEFNIESYDFVLLNLFDSNGLLISTLIEQELIPGRYTFTLETTSLSSGSYYYILKVGESEYTEKIIVIK